MGDRDAPLPVWGFEPWRGPCAFDVAWRSVNPVSGDNFSGPLPDQYGARDQIYSERRTLRQHRDRKPRFVENPRNGVSPGSGRAVGWGSEVTARSRFHTNRSCSKSPVTARRPSALTTTLTHRDPTSEMARSQVDRRNRTGPRSPIQATRASRARDESLRRPPEIQPVPRAGTSEPRRQWDPTL